MNNNETNPIVVGGRYVVGENPTYHGTCGVVQFPVDGWVGRVVEVTGGPDSFGDVQFGGGLWIDPRHLMPAPEPAAQPTVDDELLRDVGLSFRDAIDRDEDLLDEDTVRFILALEPAQRLRAAWTAKERQRTLRASAEREELLSERNQALRERDAEAAACRALIVERDAWRQAAARARAELNRLHAAQQLPDVGPVTRDDGDLMFEDGSHWHPASLDWRETTALDVVARVRAARAFLDAEAADTSSDDEDPRIEIVREWRKQWDNYSLSNDQYTSLLKALDAIRARGSQGAGQ